MSVTLPRPQAPPSRKGRTLRRTGAALFWVGLLGSSLTVAARSLLPGWALLPFASVLTAMAFVGAAILHRGRKLLARSGSTALVEDGRPPVVYLRSFAADQQGAGVISSWTLLRPSYYTDEEQLAMVMNEIGPFVAIGDPHETLPDLGAARIYVGDQDWQRTIRHLVTRAALVIMRAGTSEGFWWEFRLVHATVDPERLLLLISTDKKAYETFRTKAAEILPHPLPELPRRGRVLDRTRTIVAFEKNWRAWALPVVSSFTRTPMTAPFVARVKLTLKPIFERLGVPWSPPPVARKRMIVLGTCGAIAGAIGALFLAIQIDDYFSAGRYTPSYEASPVVLEKSAYDAALERYGARVAAVPEYLAVVRTATDKAAAQSIGRDLSRKGLRRLSDDTLLTRLVLMRRIADDADVGTCAALITGEPAPGIEAVLRRFSADDVQQWFDLSYEATMAELRQTAYPPGAQQAQIERAMQQLLRSLAPEDAQLLRSMLMSAQGKPPADACRAARLLYSGLSNLPERPRLVLARALVTP